MIPKPIPSADSRLISSFLRIFADFWWKRFSLSVAGCRDGFSASEVIAIPTVIQTF
jgi:hypothetical protein